MIFKLTDEEGVFLVKLARRAVEEYLKYGKIIKPPENTPKKLVEKCGVFVTINKVEANGTKSLRGCIGFPYPTTPLVKAVIQSAISSATEDPRFPPVTQDELNQLEIEISVLSKPEKIDDWRQIKLGKHGVIIRRGLHSGTFLPQVARETGWDLETFLSILCQQKAGLSADCYQDPATEIFVYTTETFSSKRLLT